MKKTLALFFTAVLLAGCARYDVTMNNGTKMTNVPKPKYDRDTQKYTISSGGNKTVIPSSRITMIEPHRKEQFKSNGDASEFFLPAR